MLLNKQATLDDIFRNVPPLNSEDDCAEGATGRQRISPSRLLELQIIVPPEEIQTQIGDAVEEEFTLRTLAAEQSKKADDLAQLVLGSLTLRTDR